MHRIIIITIIIMQYSVIFLINKIFNKTPYFSTNCSLKKKLLKSVSAC